MSEKYFLGAMTKHGFSTQLGEIINGSEYFTYVLKGGAGTGKSSLMKAVAQEFENTEDVVRFYCSSDPASLDAVILKNSKCVIVDGTAPHVFDPSYPAVCQKIVNLGDCWNDGELKEHKDEIVSVTDLNKSYLAKAKNISSALSDVCTDTSSCAEACIDEGKLNAFLSRFKKKIIAKKGQGSGKKTIRQLTALTEYGAMTQTDTLESYAEIYCLKDEYYACAKKVISEIAREACVRKYDVILCPSHLFNNEIYEHILIPELSIAIVTDSPITMLSEVEGKPINLHRFYDSTALGVYKPRLKENKATAKYLSSEVYKTISQAKTVHDEIESYYISSMDFEKINKIKDKIIAEIKAR